MKQILLVEDDPFLIDIYTTKFKEVGFGVEVVSRGEKVLDKIKEKKFDLVVLDVVLPELDGWEILKRIRNDRQLEAASMPVVILSNLGQREEVEKGLELGATKYLIKAHYTPSEVASEIKKIIT